MQFRPECAAYPCCFVFAEKKQLFVLFVFLFSAGNLSYGEVIGYAVVYNSVGMCDVLTWAVCTANVVIDQISQSRLSFLDVYPNIAIAMGVMK